MDTPQLTVDLLTTATAALHAGADAVLGPATDGGWWTLGLRDPTHAGALHAIPMSTPDTAAQTLAALRARGLTVALLPTLRDVDTAADAHTLAAQHPYGRFAAAVHAHLPQNGHHGRTGAPSSGPDRRHPHNAT